MEQAGSLKSLAERVREKAEQERMETEKLFASELENLRNSLQASSKNALATMENAIAKDIADATENLNQHFRLLSLAYGRSWLKTAFLGLGLMIGLALGGWMLMKGAVYWLNSYNYELAQVKVEVREQRETLETLKAGTWGVTLHEDGNGRFIILPSGMKINPTWTRGANQAIKLE